MGNRRAREFAKKQADEASKLADEAEWNRVQYEPRPYQPEFHVRGLGLRRLQLVEQPSFEEAAVFELRQVDDDWRLYRSRFVELSDMVLGYQRLELDSRTLRAMFARVTSLTLPLMPFLINSGGADGTLFELAVFGDLHSEWRFRWWSDSPPQWKPLVDAADEMLEAFSGTGTWSTAIARRRRTAKACCYIWDEFDV